MLGRMLGLMLDCLVVWLLGHQLGCLLGGPSVSFVAGFSVGSRVGQVSYKSAAKRRYGLKPDADNCADELQRLVADSERQVLPRPLLFYYILPR